eukprot:CAMPEP_0201981992 /NCGR_PEP_ID=MMETSP0904-20121228/75360_1 /ASSEMBLY_ACC=CAM_ASM_000553 /TAXON_ID=420261 /ORGANISM="Thalassiosira antarctica, Strain CCMP982" /LENGTH=48 /DNA_ID= /DNA_START= /DNA_END= /DNA_ORIENTATION=
MVVFVPLVLGTSWEVECFVDSAEGRMDMNISVAITINDENWMANACWP